MIRPLYSFSGGKPTHGDRLSPSKFKALTKGGGRRVISGAKGQKTSVRISTGCRASENGPSGNADLHGRAHGQEWRRDANREIRPALPYSGYGPLPWRTGDRSVRDAPPPGGVGRARYGSIIASGTNFTSVPATRNHRFAPIRKRRAMLASRTATFQMRPIMMRGAEIAFRVSGHKCALPSMISMKQR